MNKDILILSTADWDCPIQTNKQYIAKELSELGYRVLYVESLGIRKVKIKKSDFLRIIKRSLRMLIPFLNPQKNIYILSPMMIPGATNKFSFYLNKKLLNLKLNLAFIFLNFKRDLLWTFNPLTNLYIKLNKFKSTIYHAVDSIEHQPDMPKDLIIRNEKYLATKVNNIFVTSPNLLKKLSTYNKAISYFGNVCDFNHFAKSLSITSEFIPKDIVNIKKPIVGFIGSISEYKLDFDLINKVAKENKNISFVFIGPTDDTKDKSKIKEIEKRDNIYLLGYKKYESLPNYCAHIDVGWLPLLMNQYTKSMFPMKFFEYLAAGLPVVSTAIDSLKKYSEVAFLSENKSNLFSKNIRLAIDQLGADLNIRQKVAKENTYKIRTINMLKEIDFLN